MHGIKKVLGANESGTKTTGASAPIVVGPTVESLMKRANLFLEDADWDQAKAYFDSVLNINPEHAPAYIGKLCAELKVQNKKALLKSGKQISDNGNFKKAIRFADAEYKAELEEYIQEIKEFELKKRYDELLGLKKNTVEEHAYRVLAKRFRDMNGYADTAELANECENAAVIARETLYDKLIESKEKASTEAGYQTLVGQFRAMKDYKDAEELAKECEARYMALKAEREESARYEQQIREEKAAEEAGRAAEERARKEREAAEEKAREEREALKRVRKKELVDRTKKIILILAAIGILTAYVIYNKIQNNVPFSDSVANIFKVLIIILGIISKIMGKSTYSDDY